MGKLQASMNRDVAAFFRWWFGELAFLVPKPIRKLLGGASDFLVLDKIEGVLVVSHLTPEGEVELGRYAAEELEPGLHDRLLAQDPKLADAKAALRMASGQALRKTIKLPFAVEENLGQVLTFEMDRLTPLKSDQVYFDYRVRSRLSATRQILVDLVVVPRSRLDALLEEVARAGFRPEIVDMVGSSPLGAINLLPEKFRVARGRWVRILHGGLVGIVLVGLGAMALLPILSQQTELERLEEQVRRANREAKEVETLRQDAETLDHQIHFLQDKKRTEPIVVDMLEELSRVIPDSTWLNGLQYKDRRIVVQGQSPSASSLIELIEASKYFRNTSFVSPVTKDTASGLERFQIASDVINGRFSENPDAKTDNSDKTDHR